MGLAVLLSLGALLFRLLLRAIASPGRAAFCSTLIAAFTFLLFKHLAFDSWPSAAVLVRTRWNQGDWPLLLRASMEFGALMTAPSLLLLAAARWFCVGRRQDTRASQGAILGGTQLTGVGLSSANVEGATLDGARLRGVALNDTYLRGADLRDADFRQAVLWGADLTAAHYDEGTYWPFEFNPARRECVQAHGELSPAPPPEGGYGDVSPSLPKELAGVNADPGPDNSGR